MNWLRERTAAVLTGAAVGDALGGATEGFTPEAIEQRYGGRVEGIVPPFFADWQTRKPISPYHKGDGHVTDDTLMTQALVQVYAKRRRHLDAFDIAEDLVPLLTEQVRWIPELERETVLLERIFLAEKWLVLRLRYGHVDPREAGVGNTVNCGATMYMAPVGVVNAGDPAAAYAEAIDLAGAHQSSYGREAAGAFAAAISAALTPDADAEAAVAAALAVSHDGTRAAIQAVVEAARRNAAAAPRELAAALREAVIPFDTVGPDYREPDADARRPSRTKSIEELPVALGFLVAHRGDFRESVLAAVNYGRDSDSIATMAGAIAAALGGPDAIPAEWVRGVTEGSRIDFDHYAGLLADAAEQIVRDDTDRIRQRLERLDALAGAAS
ncbi:ADP-ribosylglycohydrolase family protein [Microbacterium elymi]|uniref:ADP-ribosylglycohydrolase family protein n=1 Tax=Microbacterium elymi TaxID=2909587 RepID=A0ABY5NHK2_9MICO|nr:ADP-ribosylglycohydrolase family protein [Microbacterium elymi]UUT34628.1 ADP-ribosylglycohydrolase family protein [Microbacterium elymi]